MSTPPDIVEKPLPPEEAPLWREMFSPKQAEDRYVSRRQLGGFLVLTSTAMFAGNVWIWIRSRLSKLTPILPRAIARLGEIPVGAVKLFSFPTANDPCLLIRRGADEYVAFEQKCTHLSCAVVYSRERDRLECPCHQGYFSATTGAVLQGPPPRPLARIRLERQGDELIAVGLETEGES
jgi:nitrite reductase/ring-hydroxylating ferredoxin subunit